MKEKIVCRNKWFSVIKRNNYHFIRQPEGVAGILKKDDDFIMVEQYRIPVNSYQIEIVRGGIERNESPLQAFIREVYEETGYKIKKEKCVYLGAIYSDSGILDTKIHIFYAETDERDVKPSGEALNIIRIDKEELDELIRENIIKDSFTLSALSLYKKRYKYIDRDNNIQRIKNG